MSGRGGTSLRFLMLRATNTPTAPPIAPPKGMAARHPSPASPCMDGAPAQSIVRTTAPMTAERHPPATTEVLAAM
jgi:hypothetical protein